jgi:RNA polymerase sigma-54 factor
MALSPKIELRTTQSLVMTPQLQQAIKLLQLSNLELAGFIEQELERNPLLEREEAEDGESPSGASEADAEDGAAAAGEAAFDDAVAVELDRLDLGVSSGIDSADAPLDTDFQNVFDDIGTGGADPAELLEAAAWSDVGGGGQFGAFEERSGELSIAQRPGLQEHLLAQLNPVLATPTERSIGAHLVASLDEAGYLAEPVDEIATQIGAAPTQVEAVLAELQRLDPPGIGARSLAECLALQLRELDRLDPAMQTLLQHLDLLAEHDLGRLMRLCRVDAEDLAEMVAEIRLLNPRPGLAFDQEIAQPVLPDVFVHRAADGGWRLELNTATLPRVLVNNRYAALVEGRHADRETRAYLAECLQSANWLVKSLDQRARTILRVAAEIVRQQEDFLNRGVQHLRPLNLRAIAEAVEMHESTISRVTSNKYMATPRGIFELKYFFTSAIASAEGGDAHSAQAVKHRIRRLIDAESVRSILSDDRLVELLRDDGVDIARRTVAKYREALGLPSSVQRRRQKRLALSGGG